MNAGSHGAPHPTSSNNPESTPSMNARRPLAFAMLIAPLIITAASVTVMLLVGGDLSREVVIHWGPNGADGWGPAWTYPVLAAAIGVALPVIMWLSMRGTRTVTWTAVVLAALMMWLTTFLGVSLTAALIVQPGDIGVWFLVAAVVGLVPAAPAMLWLPREEATPSDPTELPQVTLAPGEVAAWSRKVYPAPVFYWVMSLVFVLTLAVSIFATVVSDGRAWPIFLVPALLLVLFLLMPGWRVSAGPTGLTVRGLAGFPVFRVAITDIADATAVDLQPMAEFGGWGIRWALSPSGKSRTGIVVRAGEALQVTRQSGKQLLVTVDEAATAAAVLRAHVVSRTV